MSFSIDRYKEESKKLDVTGVDFDRAKDYPLHNGDLFALHYAMDIENHTALYLSHLLVTRACMNPVLTSFLSCWVYEELWHGENLSQFLNSYGIEVDNYERVAQIRAPLGLSNSVSIMSTMFASWVLEDFAAVYLTIGAINELTTLTSYGQMIRKTNNPVLQDLLGRIIKDERRHFAFYYNSAKEWLLDNPRAQAITREILKRFWVIVGQGVKNQEEVDALGLYLFDDEAGREAAADIDAKIRKLPGLESVQLVARKLQEGVERNRENPQWGWRLIENEGWATHGVKIGAEALRGLNAG